MLQEIWIIEAYKIDSCIKESALLQNLKSVVVIADRTRVAIWCPLVLAKKTVLYFIQIELELSYLVIEWLLVGEGVLLEGAQQAQACLLFVLRLRKVILRDCLQEEMDVHALKHVQEEGYLLLVGHVEDVDFLKLSSCDQVLSVFS